MSVSANPPVPSLSGKEGELESLRIRVQPRDLERLLSILAELPFPINPQILHHLGGGAGVEFPGYESWLVELRRALAAGGSSKMFSLEVRPMIEDLRVRR